MRRADRADSVVLGLLGLALLAAGGYGVARGYGALGSRRADEPVLGREVRDLVARNGDWFWPVAALAALFVAWLGWRWLRHQLVGDRVRRVDLSDRAGDAPTYVQAAPAAAALARDVEGYPGVRSARARLLDDGGRARVDLTVEVDDRAEVPEVNRRIEAHALSRFRHALELDELAATVRFRFGAGRPPGR